jgi:RNA polymerase sigma factor (sigma-70 family)
MRRNCSTLSAPSSHRCPKSLRPPHSPPKPAELEDFVEEIDLLLRENDYARLRSFRGDSDPKTWLFAVAKRHIGKQLQRQRRLMSLDDLPPDAFVSEPEQEGIVNLHEIERIALGEQRTLTPGEKRLFNFWREGLSDQEIAEILDRKIVTIRSKKSRMFKKIRERVGQSEKKK